MPSDLWSKTLGTDYHLYILAEHVNDSKATDYAGVPVEIGQIGHQHTWTFSAGGAEIKAYCTNGYYKSDCQYQGTANSVRLTLSAGDADYSGTAYSGASKTDNGIASITGYTVGDLFYEGTGSTAYNKSKTPPVNAGTYKATVSVTRNGTTVATAEKAFQIRKVNPVYTAPAGQELDKTGSPLELVQAGTAAGGSMEYSLDQTSWSTDVPKATEAGTYTVYYRVKGDENHNDVGIQSVTAKIKLIQMTGIQASGYSGAYDGEPHGITVEIGSNTGAIVTYGTTKESCMESSLTYTDAGTYTIYYKVSKENCADVSGSETVKIKPAEITVTAADAEKTYGEKDPEFSYQITSGELVKGEKLSGIQLTRTEGEDVTEDGYVITPSQQEGANGNYHITFEYGTFTILQKTIGIEWGTTTFVYNGAPQKPAAAATGMTGMDGTDELSLTVTGEQTGAGTGYEAKVTGITGEKAGNYRLPEKGVTITFQIDRASQNVPATAAGAAETVSKKGDGKITGVTSEMEYRKAGETAYTRAAGTEIQNLEAGTYYVRYAASANYNASDDAEVTVGAGRRLRVTLPENQTGYTLTAAASQLDWHGSTDLTFTLADGYSMTEKFAVRVNGTSIAAKNGKYRISNVEEDSVITVEGVADITAPTMKITVGENTWASFLNKLTFNLYFQKSAEVVITAEEVNTGSGLKDVHYYAADHEMTLNEVKALPDTAWTKYTGKFRIDAERKYVIYAKAADRDGNVVYISSGGMVIDRTLPTVAGIENGESCYGNFSFTATDDNLVEVIIDEKTAAPEADGRYTIPADNREHVVVVADPAGNRLEYRVTVYQIYTVTYVADGVTISTQQIGYGKNAAAPEIPAKAGYNKTAPRWDKDGRNITADTTITAVYVENEPGEFQNTTPADNAGGAKLKEDTEALKKAVPLTAEEQKLIHTGADVKIWLEVKDISATVSAKDVSLVSTKLNGSTAGMYLDVNLYKQVGTNPPEKITRLNQKVTITFALPERIINTDSNVTRTYQVIRVHNQSAEVLDVVPDAKNNTLSFATDRFSTCAVAYKDVKNSAVTYKIKATAGKGGKISPSGTVKVKEGAGKTFRITPNAGYEIDTLTVDGKKVKAKTSYKFSKVKGAHTIKVTFKKKSAESTDPKEPEAPKDPEDPKAPEDPKPSEDNKKPSAEDIQKNSDKLNITTLVTWEGSKIKVTWGKIEEADGYDIFAVRCGKELDSRSLVKSVKKTTFSVVLTKISGAKLVKQRGYKVKVKAYKMIGGKKCYIGSSSSYHVVSKENKSYTNAKKVAVSEKSVVIKKGKTSQIHAEIRKASEKKKLLSKIHGPELRYYSSNTEIATVTEKGRIKAKKKGTCFVYAVALNGVKARVAVTVK
ncbi:MAG: MBG domain-containing protein [Candidatus Limivivens sp.]|nr:MBG domain-containing protein [Candidatus Limivivens sp.]